VKVKDNVTPVACYGVVAVKYHLFQTLTKTEMSYQLHALVVLQPVYGIPVMCFPSLFVVYLTAPFQ
jgi:hypothetical protein